MAPKMFGWQHLVYVLINVIVIVLSLVFGKKYLKNTKWEKYFIKGIALLLLIFIIINRISIVLKSDNNWVYLLPNSFCGMTSLAFAIAVLASKPHNFSFHCLWYMAIVGGLVTIAYPDFIGQNVSFWYLPTISGLLHHSFLIFLSIALLVFDWFKPDLQKIYILPLGIMLYILVGYFEINVMKMSNAMCINSPLLSGTPISGYFILGVGTVLAILFNLIIIGIKKLIRLIKTKKENKPTEEVNPNE